MAAAWLGTIFNFLAGAVYNPSPTPITSGSSGPVLCDQYGRLLVSQGVLAAGQSPGTTWYDSGGALQKSGIIKASAGSLYQCFGSNEGASARWVMLFNSATVPGNGTAPIFQVPVSPGLTFSIDVGGRSRPFGTGISFAVSTTNAVLTLDTFGTFWVNAEYV